MYKKITIYVTTNSGRWGVGSTFEEALSNAKVRNSKDRISVEIWLHSLDEIVWNPKTNNYQTIDGSPFLQAEFNSRVFSVLNWERPK